MGTVAHHAAVPRLHERPRLLHRAVSGSLDNLFGTGPLEPAYTMPSYVDGVPARSYTSTDALDTETMNARIWNGFHFRSAMTDGNALGHAVADFAVAEYFQPTD